MKFAICDDSDIERGTYAAMIKDCMKKADVVASFKEYSSPKEMLFAFDDPRCMPDILYLDIKMPDMDGLTLFGHLKSRGFDGQVVFLTKSEDHWREAADQRAFNYYVKGEGKERFYRIFISVVNEIQTRNEECIILTNCGEAVNIVIRNIQYFESYHNILRVHYGDGKTFDFYSTLGKISEQLFKHHFIRIHKSYVVSSKAVSNVTFDTVFLRNGEKLPCGRTYYRGVKQEMESLLSKPKATGKI